MTFVYGSCAHRAHRQVGHLGVVPQPLAGSEAAVASCGEYYPEFTSGGGMGWWFRGFNQWAIHFALWN